MTQVTCKAKLDASCGLSAKQIGTIKFKIKRALDVKLPMLPDHVEEMLFLQGRDAWTFSWQVLKQEAQSASHPITLEVEVKLKREFASYPISPRHRFQCRLNLQPDIYAAKPTVRAIGDQDI